MVAGGKGRISALQRATLVVGAGSEHEALAAIRATSKVHAAVTAWLPCPGRVYRALTC